MQASTALMVPESHLSRVAGLNQTMRGALGVVSPPLGALLLGILPLHGIMAIDVGTAAFAIAPLLFVFIPQPPHREPITAGGAVPSLLADVRAGLSYIWHWPGLMVMMAVAAMVNFLLWPAFSLMPILVTRHFGGGAVQLGWMNSALGAGLMLGGLVLSVWGGFRRRLVTSLMGLVGMGVGTLVVGLMPATAFGLAAGGLFLTTFMMAMANGPIFAFFQAIVDLEMHARVFTVVGSMTAATSPLGMAVAGPLADAWGVRVWYVAGGIACVLMGISVFFIPAAMHLEDARPGLAVSEDPGLG
jgi:DHA3 family macrolide efflux protein-like MFS transporter